MSEQVKQEAETQSAQQEPEKTPETTLADVAKKWNVEEEVQRFDARPQSEPQRFSKSPDPVTDLEGFTKTFHELTGELASLKGELSAMKNERHEERLGSEISRAVAKINDGLEQDPDLVEAMLEKRYKTDPVLKRLWDNRRVNPGALDEALGVLGKEFAKKFQVLADPQLLENQRAAKAGQRAQQSRSEQDGAPGEAETKDMNPAQFEHWWNERKGMGF